MKAEKEIRAGFAPELRAAEDVVAVGGYAAVFDEWANIGDMFEERIAPGAFEGRLGDDVPLLINHEGLPLARSVSGTLDLSIDGRGLAIAARLAPKSPRAQDVICGLERGDLSKMSFAFSVAKEEWNETGDIPRRTITQIGRLYDVAIVTTPAYAQTDIGLRSLEHYRAALAPRNSHTARARRMRMDLALAGLS